MPAASSTPRCWSPSSTTSRRAVIAQMACSSCRETRTSSCPGTLRSTARASAGSAAYRSERPGGDRPAYADKATRIGIRVQDLLDSKILRQKLELAVAEKNVWLERVYELAPQDVEAVVAEQLRFAERLAYVSTRRSSWIAHFAPASACCSKELRGRCSTWITAPIRS